MSEDVERPEVGEAVAAIEAVADGLPALAERLGLTPFQVLVLERLFECEKGVILDGGQDQYLADLAMEVPGSP